MAELVLGLASSHSPQLSTPADGWAQRGERDKGNPELIGTDGITSNYEALLAYNCAHTYALSVALLSERIPGM